MTRTLLLVGIFVSPLSSQAIHAGENVPVAIGLNDRPIGEPHLAVHPANPKHLLGAAMVSVVAPNFRMRMQQQTCATFVSVDGGRKWDRHDFPITWCADPWVLIAPDGHALFSALGLHEAFPQQGNSGLVLFRSRDGGRTWDDGALALGPRHDHTTMALDTSSSERHGWLYIVSHEDDGEVLVVRSRDGGGTFDEPVRIAPNNLHNLAELPVVLSDGTLIVSFVDAFRQVAGSNVTAGMLGQRRAWVVRSTDGGRTFSSPRFVSEACGPIPKYRLATLTADASSGRFRDRLYFACIQRGGGAIVLSYSADRGDIWSDPIRVHAAPADTSVLRQNPTLAVNNQGVLGVAWVDSRSKPGRRCFETYFTASLDGGASFLPEQRVSSALSCPDSTSVFGTGGDYFGLVTTPDGHFHFLWSDSRTRVPQLQMAEIAVDGTVPLPGDSRRD